MGFFSGVSKKDFHALGDNVKELVEKLDKLGTKVDTESRRLTESIHELSTRHEKKIETMEAQLRSSFLDQLSRVTEDMEQKQKEHEATHETINEECAMAKQHIEESLRKQHATDEENEVTLQLLRSTCAELQEKTEKISDAISGDFFNLEAYRHEKARDSLRHSGQCVEWIVKNVHSKLEDCMEGQAILSAVFNSPDCGPPVGIVSNLQFAFYPKGEKAGLGAKSGLNCSLYLKHPVDAPWLRFNLTIGSQKRGPFDTIYKGSPLFCDLGPEINEGLPTEWDAVRISVEFLPPIDEPNMLGEERMSARAWTNQELFCTSELIPGQEHLSDQFFPFEQMASILEGAGDVRQTTERAPPVFA